MKAQYRISVYASVCDGGMSRTYDTYPDLWQRVIVYCKKRGLPATLEHKSVDSEGNATFKIIESVNHVPYIPVTTPNA